MNYSNCTQSLVDVHHEDDVYAGIKCSNACSLMCKVRNTGKEDNEGNTVSSPSVTFRLYLFIRIMCSLTLSSCFSMVDAVVLAKIKETNGDFGKQRMISLCAQATIPLLAGILVDYMNSGKKVNMDYSSAFYLGDAMLGCTVVILLFMNFKVEEKSKNMTKNIVKLLSKIEVNIFLLIVICLGANWGFLEAYLFLYLKELGASTFLMGLTLTVGYASGLPLMFCSNFIIEKAGRCKIFFVSFVCYFIRFIGYSYMQSPWVCLPFEMLEMITHQMMWVAAVTYCPILAPKGLLATMTGLLGAGHYSLGTGLGSFLGGYFISWFGLRRTFRGFGYAALVGGFLYLLAHKFILQKKIETKEKLLKLAEGHSSISIQE